MNSVYDIGHNKNNNDIINEKEITWLEIKKNVINLCRCSKSIMVSVFDVRKKMFLSCSNSFESILGYNPFEIIKGGWKFWYSLIDPREAEITRKRVSNFVFCNNVNNSAIYLKYHLKSSKGDWRLIKHELELYRIDGEIIALSCLYDFSEKEIIEHCLGKKYSSMNFNNMLKADISTREREVLKLIANGFSSKQIADKLYISNHTAISHRKHLIAKFKVNNTAQLIKKASEFIRL